MVSEICCVDSPCKGIPSGVTGDYIYCSVWMSLCTVWGGGDGRLLSIADQSSQSLLKLHSKAEVARTWCRDNFLGPCMDFLGMS